MNKFTVLKRIFLPEFLSAYISGCNTSHVLIQLIENWKTALNNNLFIRVVLMDLSKAFNRIPCDLLIGKLHAYG